MLAHAKRGSAAQYTASKFFRETLRRRAKRQHSDLYPKSLGDALSRVKNIATRGGIRLPIRAVNCHRGTAHSNAASLDNPAPPVDQPARAVYDAASRGFPRRGNNIWQDSWKT